MAPRTTRTTDRDVYPATDRRGWQEAIHHFNEAIAMDPGFAPAQAGLAET
jgi:hypothetical protein